MNQQLLDLYSDYLISSFGPTTATGLSAVLDGVVSHDQITRFLAGAKRTSAELWRVVKPHVRQRGSERLYDQALCHLLVQRGPMSAYLPF